MRALVHTGNGRAHGHTSPNDIPLPERESTAPRRLRKQQLHDERQWLRESRATVGVVRWVMSSSQRRQGMWQITARSLQRRQFLPHVSVQSVGESIKSLR